MPIEFLGDKNYKVPVDPKNQENILGDIKNKILQQKLEQIYIDFSRVDTVQQDYVNMFLQQLLPIIQSVKRIGFILKQIQSTYKLAEFCSQLKDIQLLDIISYDDQSEDFPIILLKSMCLDQIKVLNFRQNFKRSQNFHEEFIKILCTMKKLRKLNVEFDLDTMINKQQFQSMRLLGVTMLQIQGNKQLYKLYLSLFPNLQKLTFEPSYQQVDFDPDTLVHLNKLKHLSIQTIDRLRLRTLVNLKQLQVTHTFSNQIIFEDFQFLGSLQILKINCQLNLAQTLSLNCLKLIPNQCLLQIQTLYLTAIQQLGQQKNITLSINNQHLCCSTNEQIISSYPYWIGASALNNLIKFNLCMCHGELFTDTQILGMVTELAKCPNLVTLRFSFFGKRQRPACQLTQQQEQQLSLNTNLLFLETDLITSQQFQTYLAKKQFIFYQLFIFDRLIKQQLNINPSACFYDLHQSNI
ncbi:hypothetical protein ABPG74_006058 [Tetrahymena malaccensis]